MIFTHFFKSRHHYPQNALDKTLGSGLNGASVNEIGPLVMKNSGGRGGCYPPKPKAMVDKTFRDQQNSSYPTKAEFKN